MKSSFATKNIDRHNHLSIANLTHIVSKIRSKTFINVLPNLQKNIIFIKIYQILYLNKKEITKLECYVLCAKPAENFYNPGWF